MLKPLDSRHISLCLIALFITAISHSQVTYTWSGPNNGNWTTAGNWTPSRTVTATSDLLVFNDGTSKTINAVPTQTIGRLTVTSNTNIILNPASNNRTLTVGNQAGNDLVIASGSSLRLGATANNFTIALNTGGTRGDVSGTLTVDNNQVFTATAAASITTVSATGTIRNSGTVNGATAQLLFSSGATYEHTRNNGAIPAAGWNVNSTVEITGVTGGVPSGLNQAFGNFIWDCAGQTGNINFAGNLTNINGNLTIANTGTRRVFIGGSNNTVNLDVDGSLTVGSAGNSALLDMDNNNGIITIDIQGDFITAGNGRIDNTGNYNAYFNFNRPSGTQNINLGNANSFIANWGGYINLGSGSTANTVVLQTNMALANIYGTFITVGNGTTFDMSNFVISNEGTFTSNAGAILGIGHAAGLSLTGTNTGNVQVESTKTYDPNTRYNYKGSVAQVTGLGLPSTVHTLIIDNSSGVSAGSGVTLSKATTITNGLQLDNSYLRTSATNMLTINAGAAVTYPAMGNTFVAGPMRKTGSTNFVFPTGWAGISGGRIPIAVASLSASATMQAEYKRLSATTVGSVISSPLDHVSYCEYWELFPTSGSVTATVTMYWTSYSNCGIYSYVNNLASLRVARSNGTTWTNVGGVGASFATNTVQSNNATTINNSTPAKYFSLASTSPVMNPLPILFANEKAYTRSNGIQIEWSNLTEKDVVGYKVERSANGRDYTAITSLLPKSNQADKADYTSFDPYPGQNINYYRISAEDFSGKIVYSKILRVETNVPKIGMSLYPNPVINQQLSIALKGAMPGTYNICIVNTAGQQVYQRSLSVQGNMATESFALPASIGKGVYSLQIKGQGYTESQTFIVR